MFRCERCGSRYSALHAATMENCPRCMVRDRTASPLTFKAFQQLPDRSEAEDEGDHPPAYRASAASSGSLG